MSRSRVKMITTVWCLLCSGILMVKPTFGQDIPVFLQDRGPGTPTDMFGTYCQHGELLMYPFFEYYMNEDGPYNPEELGFDLDEDFEGKFRSDEWLFYIGYGLTEDIVIALETALYVRETQWKASEDTSAMPNKFKESGFGDTGLHIHWRFLRETANRPAFFTYLEVGLPLQKDRDMIGTPAWEFVPGVGIIKGFSWGTLTGKASLEYSLEDEEVALGECAIEYLKRLSSSWRIYLGIAGDGEEVELIPEMQWHINENIFVKLNSAFGLTPETADWAPEVGVMFSF